MESIQSDKKIFPKKYIGRRRKINEKSSNLWGNRYWKKGI